jgi:hypothetical protein
VDSDELVSGAIDAGHLASGVGGKIVQVVNVIDTVVDTTTTVLPFDDTIPTTSEGKEMMTLAITPTNINNKLLVQVYALYTIGTDQKWAVGALFNADVHATNAISYTWGGYEQGGVATVGTRMALQHYMTVPTVSATTFSFRMGPDVSATLTFNGQSGGRFGGGIMSSGITIMEIQV